MYEGVVIHFGELWLKGRNRHEFVSTLYSNIVEALGPGFRLVKLRDRFILEAGSEEELERACSTLKKVFGISWFAPFISAKPYKPSIISSAQALYHNGESVRIIAHRSYKGAPFTSAELVSEFIHSSSLSFVPSKDAKNLLFIDVLKDIAILHKEKMEGAHGLPVGTSGKAVVLLSGGIDSPAAAYMAMKRGLDPVYVHFYALPTSEDVEKSKIPKIIEALKPYGTHAKTYLVPAHMLQMAALKVGQKYEVLLFKKFMYSVADRIAEAEHAKALVTGESLGQVSSQTVENLIASSAGINKLIFRPLIGLDKEEIIKISKAIGTYELSIMPYKDACSMRSKSPLTRITAPQLEEVSEKVGIKAIVDAATQEIEASNAHARQA
ncbi:MAG: tRNA 4-thiouridine(8) synthase ThiI [Candidatus Marsarchaeota archaeon]|nr:tRNA 4-thiouridine(8) synthase ThiI [Candidatus Marsarchaeota archaeon]